MGHTTLIILQTKLKKWKTNPYYPYCVLWKGAIIDDKTNCDETESLGCSIQMKLDNLKFSEASIKQKDWVTTLASLNNQIRS